MGRREEAKQIAAAQRAWDNREVLTPPATDAYRRGWLAAFGCMHLDITGDRGCTLRRHHGGPHDFRPLKDIEEHP